MPARSAADIRLRTEPKSRIFTLPSRVMNRLAEVEDEQDVRMAQGGNAPGLTLESSECGGVGRQARRQHLDRDIASESSVPAIDLAHSPQRRAVP